MRIQKKFNVVYPGFINIDYFFLFFRGGSLMSGWLPIFDTINGVRGEVNVQVKVELFSDHNKFRQSSCGVQFFCSTNI